MAYTDKQLKEATQIAYADFQEAFEECEYNGEQPPFSIGHLIEVSKTLPESKLSVESLDRIQGLSEEIYDWKIVKCWDKNESGNPAEDNGFYSCIIETDDNNAIVAFRGSEDMGNYYNLLHDWTEADLGLLNSIQTKQQIEAENFLDHMNNKGILNQYENIAVTGHSLGGNLADHFTISSTKYEDISNKITQSVSFDGPNFSNEYIEAHADAINKVAGKMKHYRWSVVSSLLHELPGVEQEFLQIKDYEIVKGVIEPDLGEEFYQIFGRHNTFSLIFDENGNAIRGEIDEFSVIMGDISKKLDDYPSIVGDTFYNAVYGTLLSYGWLNGMFDGDKYNTVQLILLDTVRGFIKTMIISNVVTNAFIIVGMVSAIAVVLLGGIVIYELGVWIVNEIGELLQWTSEMCYEMTNYFMEQWYEFKNEFQAVFNSGYQYAINNSEICVNTDSLRGYADRLYNVNNRIVNLDSSIKSLYGKVGFLDLLDLIKADILTGYSWRLGSCQNYLYNTADSFDNAENNIKKVFE